MADGTAALRAAAAHWSLAGDQQLLDILQNIHQRVMSRCNETTARLEAMSRGLRDASVNLQNVNNKFLALSNTQFVESRVYEDDADLAAPPAVTKDPPQLTDLSSDLSKLKQSLRVLESYHEPLHILRDSDSDSDSDGGDDRLVLKPRDLYSDRPLPYIIGSQAWKSKWHAGLIQDESDSDSSTSKAGEVEQYSDSDEQTDRQDLDVEYQPARKQSSGSSSQSELAAVPLPPVQPSPSLVAAELARRLGAGAKLPEREPVYSEPEPVRKLYKPQQTPSATIFPDEPPPLDEASSDDDIFAELHKPRRQRLSNVEDALFDFSPKANSLEEALFGRAPDVPEATQNVATPLYEDDLMPEVTGPPEVDDKHRDDTVKKPVGGISLFGTNKHAESIGAAILKRNRRKSSTSGDESNTEEYKEAKEVKEVKEVRKERDIFDDLFAKSEKSNKKSVKSDVVAPKEVSKKKDVFSDIFDDIDDIFSTDIINVPIKETKKNEKPLFDDDDDLFADLPKVTNETGKEKLKNVEKTSLFDDNKPKSEANVAKDSKINVVKEIKKESKSLFDSDSDDGLFTKGIKDNIKDKVNKSEEPVEYKISDDIFGDDDDSYDLFGKNKPVVKEKTKEPLNVSKATEVTKTALFDSEDELFTKSSKAMKTPKEDTVSKNDSYYKDDDTLFVKEVKRTDKELKDGKSINDSNNYLLENEEKSKALKVIESINSNIYNNGDDLFRKSETLKESKIDTVHDDFDSEELFSDKNLFSSSKDTSNKTGETQKIVKIPKDLKFGPPNDDISNKPDAQIGNLLNTTRIAVDAENVQTDKSNQEKYNDSNEELFKTSSSIPEPKEAEEDEDDFLYKDTTKPEIPELVSTQSVKNDIFSDIFDDVPPIFEKPKEPKKSQNVNALFGDDSDDEALFFKKNDVISDEKPDFSPSEERFGIFNDEPPAIDVDFIQKPVKNDGFAQDAPKTEDLPKSLDISEGPALKAEEIDKTITAKETQDTTDNTSKEPKKVGKLKPMNFNINVNTLLPGASPKKKQLEVTDGQTASNEELHKTDKIEPKMVKSISFDDPEILDNKISKDRAKIQVKRRPSTRRARKEAVRKSAIDLTDSSLDSSNDNSAKDDVKVVKTVYILNDEDIFGDSTKNHDNAFGTESTKKHLNIVDSDEELFKKAEKRDETDSKLTKEHDTKNNEALKGDGEKKLFSDSDDDLFKSKNSGLRETIHDVKIEKGSKFLNSDDSDDLFKPCSKVNRTAENTLKSNSSDEDLFKNNKTKASINKSLLDSDDNDDLFTNKTAKAKAETVKSNISSDDEDLFTNVHRKGIETLGNVYKTDIDVHTTNVVKEERKTYNVFDDFPPKPNPTVVEELIKPKVIEKETKIVKPVVKKSILDVSSDEDDLFKAKTKLTTKKDEQSLFGDDNGDDDDLFGARTVKEQKQEVPAPQSTKEAKATETVFVDPLSLFGDDE